MHRGQSIGDRTSIGMTYQPSVTVALRVSAALTLALPMLLPALSHCEVVGLFSRELRAYATPVEIVQQYARYIVRRCGHEPFPSMLPGS
jgi:hypothetical protein